MSADAAALLSHYADAWASGRTADIAAHWDAAHFRFYKAEEVRHVFATWDDTLAYWQANEAMHERVRLAFADVRPVPLEGPWSLLWCTMRWDIAFAAAAPGALAGKAMGGDNHVLALLHGDRLAGWSETPDAAITYIRGLYEAQARI